MTEDILKEIRIIQQSGDIKITRKRLEELTSTEIGKTPAFKALYGAVLIQDNSRTEGEALIKEASLELPTTSSWASDLGYGLFLLGNIKAAREALESAVAFPDSDGVAFNRLAVVRLINGDPDGAWKGFEKAIYLNPEKAEFHCNMGGLAAQSGKLNEALACFENALRINPDLPQAKSGRTALLVAFDRVDEAIVEAEEKLEHEPDSISLRIQLANLLNAADRYDEAISILKEAMEIDGKDISVQFQLAMHLFNRGRFRAVIKILEKILETEPENHNAMNLITRAYSETGNHEKAIAMADNLLSLKPDNPANFVTRAFVHSENNNYGDSENDLRRALEIFPGFAEAWSSLGHNLMLTGRLDEAVVCYEKAAKINPFALAALIEARSFPGDPEIIEKMIRFADNPLVAKEPRASMLFALTKVFEKQEDFYNAFVSAEKANAIISRTISYDPEDSHNRVKQLEKFFTPELFARFKGKGIPSERPVFVVGMPRSGTTLTEQILCSHSKVFGAGELGYVSAITHLMPRVLETKTPYPFCLPYLKRWMAAHAASYYLKKLAKMDNKAIRTVDKMPHNFFNAGLIALIFPKARIIHVKRDPRDIAVSNYFTNFKQKHGGMGYSFDLRNIAHLINDHDRIMAHWDNVLPVTVYKLQYEQLLEEPGKISRELLDFIGLEWEDTVMEFYRTERAVKTASVWQVRQPMYKTSRERWRKYEAFLHPFLELLDNKPD